MSPIAPHYGNDIVFTCATNTNSDATGYRWYKDGILESSSNENTLPIASVTHVSDGNWACVASSSRGDSLESNAIALKISSKFFIKQYQINSNIRHRILRSSIDKIINSDNYFRSLITP